MFIILWKASEVETKVVVSLVVFDVLTFDYDMGIMIQKFYTGL